MHADPNDAFVILPVEGAGTEIGNRDAALAQARKEILALRRHRLQNITRCQELQNKLEDAQAENKRLIALMNFRQGRSRISPFGGYTLAIKRSIGLSITSLIKRQTRASRDEEDAI